MNKNNKINGKSSKICIFFVALFVALPAFAGPLSNAWTKSVQRAQQLIHRWWQSPARNNTSTQQALPQQQANAHAAKGLTSYRAVQHHPLHRFPTTGGWHAESTLSPLAQYLLLGSTAVAFYKAMQSAQQHDTPSNDTAHTDDFYRENRTFDEERFQQWQERGTALLDYFHQANVDDIGHLLEMVPNKDALDFAQTKKAIKQDYWRFRQVFARYVPSYLVFMMNNEIKHSDGFNRVSDVYRRFLRLEDLEFFDDAAGRIGSLDDVAINRAEALIAVTKLALQWLPEALEFIDTAQKQQSNLLSADINYSAIETALKLPPGRGVAAHKLVLMYRIAAEAKQRNSDQLLPALHKALQNQMQLVSPHDLPSSWTSSLQETALVFGNTLFLPHSGYATLGKIDHNAEGTIASRGTDCTQFVRYITQIDPLHTPLELIQLHPSHQYTDRFDNFLVRQRFAATDNSGSPLLSQERVAQLRQHLEPIPSAFDNVHKGDVIAYIQQHDSTSFGHMVFVIDKSETDQTVTVMEVTMDHEKHGEGLRITTDSFSRQDEDAYLFRPTLLWKTKQ